MSIAGEMKDFVELINVYFSHYVCIHMHMRLFIHM